MLGVRQAPVGRHHQGARFKERGRYADGGMQEAPGVVSHVQHQAGQLAVRLFVHALDRAREVVDRTLLELRDANVRIAGLDQFGLDALNAYDLANQRKFQRPVLALARDRELDGRLGLAAHFLDRVGKRETLGRLIVDLDDEIARLHAGTGSRRVLDRCDNPDIAVFGPDFDSQAAEFPANAGFELLVLFRVQIGRMRVELGQHALDRAGQEFFVFHRFDVTLLDVAEYFGQGLDFGQRQRVARFPLSNRGKIQSQENAGHDADADKPAAFPLAVHVALQCCSYKAADTTFCPLQDHSSRNIRRISAPGLRWLRPAAAAAGSPPAQIELLRRISDSTRCNHFLAQANGSNGLP